MDTAFAPLHDRLGTVDLQKAISAHVRWKTKIALYNDGQLEETLDPTVIAQDSSCELGQMLADLPADMQVLPEFAALSREHRTLHAAGAGLVMRIADGERIPESELGMGSAFAELSSSVLHGLTTLWHAMERARGQ